MIVVVVQKLVVSCGIYWW